MPTEFLTWQGITTYAGAVIATMLVVATLTYLVPQAKPYAKWVAVVFAVALMVFSAFRSSADATGYLVAVLNGLLVFLASVGANTVTTPPPANAWTVTPAAAAPPAASRYWARW